MKAIARVTIEIVSFVPTELHIWHSYVWFWRLLVLWIAPGAVQWRSRQMLAVARVREPLQLARTKWNIGDHNGLSCPHVTACFYLYPIKLARYSWAYYVVTSHQSKVRQGDIQLTNHYEMSILSMRNFVVIEDLQSIVKFTLQQPKSFRFIISCISNQILPSCTWFFMPKYSNNFPFLLILNILSCWIWVPMTTCMKRLNKRDVKD